MSGLVAGGAEGADEGDGTDRDGQAAVLQVLRVFTRTSLKSKHPVYS
jgi:hypothetical protein